MHKLASWGWGGEADPYHGAICAGGLVERSGAAPHSAESAPSTSLAPFIGAPAAPLSSGAVLLLFTTAFPFSPAKPQSQHLFCTEEIPESLLLLVQAVP